MARGWESKAVADQIEEGKSAKPTRISPNLTTEERAEQQKMNSLLLSKNRVLAQLERATHPAHRQVLLKGLQAIESEIDELSKK